MRDHDQDEIAQTLERLGSPVLDIVSTELLIVKLLQLRNPAVQVNLKDEGTIEFAYADGRTSLMFLANLHAEVKASPEERVAIVERYIRVLGPGDSHQQTDLKNIVVLVRDETYRQFVRAEERESIAEHLIADLWVLLALDLPESTLVLSLEQFVMTKLSKAELLMIALENTAHLLEDLEVETCGELFFFSASNQEYLSGVLLLESVWEQVKSMVKGDVIAAAPARDMVVFTGSENPKGISELRTQIDFVLKNGHHTISGTILRRTAGGWKVFS